VISVGCVWICS